MDSNLNSEREDSQLRKLPTWVRRYARHHRGLQVAIALVLFLVAFAAIGGGSYIAGNAYRAGNLPVTVIAGAVALAGLLFNSVMAFSMWGRQLPNRLAARMGFDEGEVTLSEESSDDENVNAKRWMATVLGVFLASCILASVAFGGSIPLRFRQPVTALYVVPFLIGNWLLNRPNSGIIQLLWPLLFAAHAIVLICGGPILFTGKNESLNLLIPIIGYGLVTHILSHFVARFSLGYIHRITKVKDGQFR